MTSDEWILDPESQAKHLTPWLEREPDAELRERVLEYIAGILRDPIRPRLEDRDERIGERSGDYSAEVGSTGVGVIWTVNRDERRVVLAFVGPF